MNHQLTLFQYDLKIEYIISRRIVEFSLSMIDGLIVYTPPLKKITNGKFRGDTLVECGVNTSSRFEIMILL